MTSKLADARRALVLTAVLGALGALALAAAPAGAVITGSGGGKVSVMPIHSSAPLGFAQGGGNLIYHNGNPPVMHSNHTYAIYWDGNGGTDLFDTGYKTLINQFLTDVGTDSAGGHSTRTNVYSTTDQYTDSTGPAAYDSSFVTSFTDTDAFPASGSASCTYAGFTRCLTKAQIESEIDTFLTAHSLPRGLSNIYFLFTPAHIESCLDSSHCSNTAYCAFHTDATPVAGEFLWANFPYIAGNAGCDKGQRPNGASADSVLSAVSHEQKETITDPQLNAWFDNFGFESSDKCNFEFGTVTGTPGAQFNQTIAGRNYLIQQDWSNKDYTATGVFNDGCRLSDQLPTASFTTSAPAPTRTVTFTASGSDPDGTVTGYSWNFGDGSPVVAGASVQHVFALGGPHNVTLGVTDNSGNTTTSSQSVTASPAPVAAFGATPAATSTRTAVALNAAASTGDAPLTYTWTFGDGGSGTGATTSHAFARSGVKTVQLTVRDSSNRTSTITHTVRVSNRKPTASFGVAAGRHAVKKAFGFNARGSKDADGRIVKYSWSFGDRKTGSGTSPKHSYAKPGTYRVTLVVTDDQGAKSSSVTHTVTIHPVKKKKRRSH